MPKKSTPQNQVLPVRSTDWQGSLLLTSKRLQLFAYVLAELTSAATLLQDYTRAKQRIPERLTASWQMLAVAAAWRVTLDYTIRLYARNRVKRWLRSHQRRRRQRHRHALTARERNVNEEAEVSSASSSLGSPATAAASAATAEADLTQTARTQQRLSSARCRPRLTPHKRRTRTLLGADSTRSDGVREVDEEEEDGHQLSALGAMVCAGVGQCDAGPDAVTSFAHVPTTPRRFFTGRRTLDGASFPASRRGSGYLRRVAPLSYGRAATVTPNPSAPSSPSAHSPHNTRVSAPAPSVCRAPQPLTPPATEQDTHTHIASAQPGWAPRPPRPPRRLPASPFPWTSRTIHNKLARLFGICRVGEDALGQRIESLRATLVAALFDQFLDVRVQHSANDLVLYRWLDRRRYLTAAQERALEVALVARAEHTAARHLLTRLRRRAHTRQQLTRSGGSGDSEGRLDEPSSTTRPSPYRRTKASEEREAAQEAEEEVADVEDDVVEITWDDDQLVTSPLRVRATGPDALHLAPLPPAPLSVPVTTGPASRRSQTHPQDLRIHRRSASSRFGSDLLSGEEWPHVEGDGSDVPGLCAHARQGAIHDRAPHSTRAHSRDPLMRPREGSRPSAAGLPSSALGTAFEHTVSGQTHMDARDDEENEKDDSCEDDDDDSLLAALSRDAPPAPHLAASMAEKVLLDVVPMPLQLFMRAAASFSPTICAFSLLSRCVVYASQVRNNEETSDEVDAAYARFLERERAGDVSAAGTAEKTSYSDVPQYYHLVIANREVGHCAHSIPCFGNRKFIFVPCADADALVRDDDDDKDQVGYDSSFSDTSLRLDADGRTSPHQRREGAVTTGRDSDLDQDGEEQPRCFPSTSTYETIETDEEVRPRWAWARQPSPLRTSPLTSSSDAVPRNITANEEVAAHRGEDDEQDKTSVSSPSPTATSCLDPAAPRQRRVQTTAAPRHEPAVLAGADTFSSLSATADSRDPLNATSSKYEDVSSLLAAVPSAEFMSPPSTRVLSSDACNTQPPHRRDHYLHLDSHHCGSTCDRVRDTDAVSLPALHTSFATRLLNTSGTTDVRSTTGSRRRTRRSSGALPDATHDARARLLFLGDQLPASANVSAELACVTDDEDEGQEGSTLPIVLTHEAMRPQSSRDSACVLPPTAADRNPGQDGLQAPIPRAEPCSTVSSLSALPRTDGPRASASPLLNGSSALLPQSVRCSTSLTNTPTLPSAAAPSSAKRRPRQVPLAPPPFIELASSAGLSPSALRKCGICMVKGGDDRANEGAAAGSGGTSQASVVNEEDSVVRDNAIVHTSDTARRVKLIPHAPTAAMRMPLPAPRAPQTLAHGTDQQHDEHSLNATYAPQNATMFPAGNADEENEGDEEDEEEAPFFVMRARYCSAPAEAQPLRRPALTEAAQAEVKSQSHNRTREKDGASANARSSTDCMPAPGQTASDVTTALVHAKAWHDAVGVASTMPTTTLTDARLPLDSDLEQIVDLVRALPAPPPVGTQASASAFWTTSTHGDDSDRRAWRARAEAGALVPLQTRFLPSLTSHPADEAAWHSRFHHTLHLPPDSGHALSFEPPNAARSPQQPIGTPPRTPDAVFPDSTTVAGLAQRVGAPQTDITPFTQDASPAPATSLAADWSDEFDQDADEAHAEVSAAFAAAPSHVLNSPIQENSATCGLFPTSRTDSLTEEPSEGDMAFAAELIARLQFWCVRGQPRDAYVLNPQCATPAVTTAVQAGDHPAGGAGAAAEFDCLHPTTRSPPPVPSQSPQPGKSEAKEDRELTSAAPHPSALVVRRPIKLLYSYVGEMSFEVDESLERPEGQNAAENPVQSTRGHLVVNEEGCGTEEDASASLDSSSSGSNDLFNSSFFLDDGFDSSESEGVDDDDADDIPDIVPPTAPTNLRGRELLYAALEEASEVVVCALRECRPHKGYHDLWHVGNTRLAAAGDGADGDRDDPHVSTTASLLKTADTLSDVEEDVTGFDRCEHLHVSATVLWAQGAMAPRSASSAWSDDTSLLFPRKTIGAHDRAQWQLERLRNEYRVARSSRLDALLIDDKRGKVIAAITLESTWSHPSSTNQPQHAHGSATKRRSRGAASAAHTATDTTCAVHPVMPSESTLFIGDAAETNAGGASTQGVLERATRFRVLSFTPYISPLWRHLHNSKVLLVDMDRTLVDNAITISPNEQRQWLINEQQRRARLERKEEEGGQSQPHRAWRDDDGAENTRACQGSSDSPRHHEQGRVQQQQPQQPRNLLDDFFKRTGVQQRAGHTFHYEERQPVTYFMTTSTRDKSESATVRRTDSSGAWRDDCGSPDYHKPITELICVRPGIRQWLHRTATQWGIPIIMVTKSSRQRAEAIVRHVLDPQQLLFQRYETHIVTAEAITRVAAATPAVRVAPAAPSPTASGSGGMSALMEAKKSVLAVLRAAFTHRPVFGPHAAKMTLPATAPRGPPESAHASEPAAARNARQLLRLFHPCTVARSVAIIDDSPQVWMESDWQCTVLIAPYTLVRVDPRYYLSHNDGYLSSLTASCLFSTRCLVCPQRVLDSSTPSGPRSSQSQYARIPRGSHCSCACPAAHRRRVVMVKRRRPTDWLPCSAAVATMEEAVAEEVSSSSISSTSSSSARFSASLARHVTRATEETVEDVSASPPRRVRREEQTSSTALLVGVLQKTRNHRRHKNDEDLSSSSLSDGEFKVALPAPFDTAHRRHHLASRRHAAAEGNNGRHQGDPDNSADGGLLSIPRDELNMSLEATTTPGGGHYLSPAPRADACTPSERARAAVPTTPNSFTFAVPPAPLPDDLLWPGGDVGARCGDVPRSTEGCRAEEDVSAAPSRPAHFDQSQLAATPRAITSGIADEEADVFTPSSRPPPQSRPSSGLYDAQQTVELQRDQHEEHGLSSLLRDASRHHQPHRRAPGPHSATIDAAGDEACPPTWEHEEGHCERTTAPHHRAWSSDDVEDVFPQSVDPAHSTMDHTYTAETVWPSQVPAVVEEPVVETATYRPTSGRFSDTDVEDVTPL